MLEAVEKLVRANEHRLIWAAILGWAAIGLLALGLSLRSRCRNRVAWIGSAIVSLIFSAEMAYPHRFDFIRAMRSILRSLGGEEAIQGRRPLQAAVILVLIALSIVILVIFLKRCRRLTASSRWVVLGLGVDLFGYLLETISLHQIDANYIIYWTIWYSGMTLALIGLGLEWLRSSETAGSVAESTHARYSVASLGLRDESDRLIHRGFRLGLLILVLTIPEWVGLITRLIVVK